MQAWELVPLADDPFAAEAVEPPLTGTETCAADAVLTESGMLEIDTDVCNFVTLRTTTVEEIRAGETVRVLFWNLALVADPPAVGVVELRLGGQTWWRHEAAIPGPEAIHKPKQVASRAFPKGTPVLFHVHNHGANSWRLLDWTTGD